MKQVLRVLCGTVFLGAAGIATAQVGSRAHPVSQTAALPKPVAEQIVLAPSVSSLAESFDDVAALSGNGWVLLNNSTPVGLIANWFQGTDVVNGGPFDAHSGASNAYIAANYNFTSGANTIDGWLITPELDFGGSTTLTFWTRKPSPDSYADRLEVRLSTAGASANVADFTDVVLSINPSLVLGVYPTVWTQYTVTNAQGLPHSGSGRVAFRYYVTNGGPNGANSDYIGIDTLAFNAGTPEYRVGGNVSGLLSSGLELTLAGGTPLSIAADGAFQLPDWVQDGVGYEVQISQQPTGSPSQTCALSNETGTVAGVDVTNVGVTCTTDSFSVGGNVSGLAGSGLVLQNNDSDDLPIAADGSFTFSTPLSDLSAYAVTVLTQPDGPSQTCAVTNGSGNIAGADVTDVSVVCTTDSFTVGGSVSGLVGTGLVLQNEGADDLPVAADGSFVFATPLTDLSAYAVTVATQPAGPAQTCTVNNGAGNVAGANVTDVSIDCVTDAFTLTILDGASQAALFNTAFPDLLTVEVRDGDGQLVEGTNVLFEAPLAGASAMLDDGVQTASDTLTVATDVNGVAIVNATANNVAGCYGVTASNVLAPVAVVFELTNVSPEPEIFTSGFEDLLRRLQGTGICAP